MADSLPGLSSTASTTLSKPVQHVQPSGSDGTQQVVHADPGMAYWMRTQIPEEELRENEELEARFWKHWTPEVDWRNGEYYPQIRHPETGKWFDAKGYDEALDKLLDKRNGNKSMPLLFITNSNVKFMVIPVKNGVSAQVAMAVVRDLEDEMEREYQATRPTRLRRSRRLKRLERQNYLKRNRFRTQFK